MSPKHTERPAVERALQAVEALQLRLAGAHAAEFTALELTMSQAKLLYVVMAHGPLTMSEVAGQLGVTLSTASGAVDHLVSAGLLTRADDPANRRQVHVAVTRVGLSALEQMREFGEGQLRSLFDHIPDDDVAVVERAMEILTRAVDAADRRIGAAELTHPVTTQTGSHR
jgi:DNA-binding MarR family transcriptional regulator